MHKQITADDVVRTAWICGHSLEHTMKALQAYGFLVSKAIVLETWVQLDDYYQLTPTG